MAGKARPASHRSGTLLILGSCRIRNLGLALSRLGLVLWRGCSNARRLHFLTAASSALESFGQVQINEAAERLIQTADESIGIEKRRRRHIRDIARTQPNP